MKMVSILECCPVGSQRLRIHFIVRAWHRLGNDRINHQRLIDIRCIERHTTEQGLPGRVIRLVGEVDLVNGDTLAVEDLQAAAHRAVLQRIGYREQG